MSELKNELKHVARQLNYSLDKLDKYKGINPKIAFISNLIGMISSSATDIADSVDDILAELSDIPDNFSDILNDVNLLVSSNDSVVSVTAIPKEDGFNLDSSILVKDNNFVSALLKIYACVTDESLPDKYFSKRVSIVDSGLGRHTKIPVPTEPYVLVLDDGESKTEILSDTIADNYSNDLFTIQDLDGEKDFIRLIWQKPFVGNICVVGIKNE